MKVKRIACLLLAVLMVLSMAACGKTVQPSETQPDPEEIPETGPADHGDAPDEWIETRPVYQVEGLNGENVTNPIVHLSLSMGKDYQNIYSLNAWTNDDGSATVEFVGQIKKVGAVDEEVLKGMTKAFEKSGLTELNGRMEYADGTGFGSMYVVYADGTLVAADFSGLLPEEFKEGYRKMEECFTVMTEAMPEYVPTPQLNGNVDPVLLEEMHTILSQSGIEALDTLVISEVPMDEFFTFTVGLSDSEGIQNGASCAAMMMTTPYSFVIVTAGDESAVDGICQDFEKSMDWGKWVCVNPENALIARKGNLVLCLMGSSTLYSGTAAGITAAGWTVVKTLDNPAM